MLRKLRRVQYWDRKEGSDGKYEDCRKGRMAKKRFVKVAFNTRAYDEIQKCKLDDPITCTGVDYGFPFQVRSR